MRERKTPEQPAVSTMHLRSDDSIRSEKAQLRRLMEGATASLLPEAREFASARARELLVKQRQWSEAGALLLFAPMAGELDVWPLAQTALALGKRVGFPRYHRGSGRYTACQVRDLDRDIRPGWYGIREPVEHCGELRLNRLDLILVPGVAFDLQGRRLGRGKGFYDQLLSAMPGIRCGVAFDQQVVEAVPVAPHDVHVNCILTPTRWRVF